MSTITDENNDHSAAKRAYSVTEFAERWGISRSTIYNLAGDGKLRLSKIMGKTIITVEADAQFAKLVNEGDAAAEDRAAPSYALSTRAIKVLMEREGLSGSPLGYNPDPSKHAGKLIGDYLIIPNCGKRTIAEINDWLAANGHEEMRSYVTKPVSSGSDPY